VSLLSWPRSPPSASGAAPLTPTTRRHDAATNFSSAAVRRGGGGEVPDRTAGRLFPTQCGGCRHNGGRVDRDWQRPRPSCVLQTPRFTARAFVLAFVS